MRILKLNWLKSLDQYQHLTNCEPTPLLNQQQVKVDVELGEGWVDDCSDTDFDLSVILIWHQILITCSWGNA